MLAGALGSPTPTTPPQRRDRCSAMPHPRPAGLLCPRAPLAVSSFNLVPAHSYEHPGQACPFPPPMPTVGITQTGSLFLRATLLCSWGSGAEEATQGTGDCTGCPSDTARCEVVRKCVVLLGL